MRSARLILACVVAALSLLSLALLYVTVQIWSANYDALAHVLVVRAGKAHQEGLFKARYFTPAAYAAVRLLAAAATMAMAGLTVVSAVYARRAAAGLQTWRQSASVWADDSRARFSRLRSGTKLAIAILLIAQAALALVRIADIPVSYDEAWTYVNFTSRPLYTALSYYPAPNNHILFSVLTVITGGAPWPPLITMRLISLAFSLATTLTLFWIGVRAYDERAAIVGLSLFVFSFPVSLYAVQARGYAMLLFFTANCFSSLSAFRADPRRRWPLAAYIATSVLGFYTIPSFLYPFASISALVLAHGVRTKQWRVIVRPLAIACGVISAMTLMLYAPVFLISGPAAVISNPDVQRLPLSIVVTRLPQHLAATANWLCGVRAGGLSIVLALAAVSGYLISSTAAGRGRNQQASMLAVLLLPPVIVLVHRVIPFERTWIYLLIPICLLIMAMADRVLAREAAGSFGRDALLPAVAVAVAIMASVPFRRQYAREYARDFEADRLFAEFPSASVRTVAYDDVYFADLLTYKLQRERREPVLARRWASGMRLDADALVLSRASALPIVDPGAYVLWRDSETIRVYLRKPAEPR